MAELSVEGNELVLRLSRAERLESLHGDLRVPLGSVRSVEVLEDAHVPADVPGWRTGTRIPRVVEVATVSAQGRRIFAAVHHDTPRGVRVRLDGQAQEEWVVGCADPEDVVRALRAAGVGS
jgi:hypothetical protein